MVINGIILTSWLIINSNKDLIAIYNLFKNVSYRFLSTHFCFVCCCYEKQHMQSEKDSDKELKIKTFGNSFPLIKKTKTW